MWHIIWNGFLIITPTDNKIRGPSCCDYAFHKFGFEKKKKKEKKQGDISIWMSVQYVDMNFTLRWWTLDWYFKWSLRFQLRFRFDQWERLTPSREILWIKNLGCNLTWLCCKEKKHLSSEARCTVFYEQKAWTVTSSLNDYWQIPCLPVARFLFATAQSRDNLARDAVCLVNREAHCRSNAICLVFYEMNQRLGDQWAPVVNANNATGSLSGARCQSVASEACTFPGYTIGLWN